jgi:hypothetical protein
MLDLVRLVVLVFALASAARQRFVIGVTAALAIVYALAASTLGVARAVQRGTVTGEYAMGLLFLGPSTIPTDEHLPLPGGTWLSSHTLAAVLGTTLLGLVPLAWAWRHATQLSPHSVESRRWDTVSAAFLLLTVIDLTRLLMGWVSARQEV